MRWPWVSRLAFDLVVAERDRLLVTKQAQVMGNERQTIAQQPIVVPDSIEDLINGLDSEPLRVMLRGEAIDRRRGGSTWEQIEGELTRQLGSDE